MQQGLFGSLPGQSANVVDQELVLKPQDGCIDCRHNAGSSSARDGMFATVASADTSISTMPAERSEVEDLPMPLTISINNLAGELQHVAQADVQDTVANFLGTVGQAHKFHSGVHVLDFATEAGVMTEQEQASELLVSGNKSPTTLIVAKRMMLMLATISENGVLQIVNAASGQRLRSLEIGGVGLGSSHTIFSPNGALVLTGYGYGTANIWDVQTSTCLHTFHCNHTLCFAKFSSDSALVLTVYSKAAEVWDVQTGTRLHFLQGDDDDVFHVAKFSMDSTLVLTGYGHGIVKVWDVQTGNCLYTLEGLDDYDITCARFSADSALVVTGYGHGFAMVSDAQTGTCLHILQGDDDYDVIFAKFSANSALVVTGDDHGTVRVWDAQIGRCLQVLPCNANAGNYDLCALKLSSDSAVIVTGYTWGHAKVWDVQTGNCLHILQCNFDSIIRLVRFSSDSALVVTGYGNGTAKMWDMQTGNCLHTLHGNGLDELRAAKFSADSALVLIGYINGTAKVWDVQTGNCLITHANCVHSLWASKGTFIPDAVQCILANNICERQADSQLHAETQPELDLDALERVLLEDNNSSCLQQQADVEEAILRSSLSDPMSSLQKQCNGGSQHGASQASSSGCSEDAGQSVISSAGSEPKCYICGTRFRASDGTKKAVEDIGTNEVLLGVDGSYVKVVSIKRHTSMDQVMVLLRTSSSQIVLTHNHRVLTLRGASQRQTIPAGHLREGDAILSTRGQEQLIEVMHFLGEDDDVYEIVLEPDAEIEAFYINSENTAILTKGKRSKSTHRGNMRRRSS